MITQKRRREKDYAAPAAPPPWPAGEGGAPSCGVLRPIRGGPSRPLRRSRPAGPFRRGRRAAGEPPARRSSQGRRRLVTGRRPGFLPRLARLWRSERLQPAWLRRRFAQGQAPILRLLERDRDAALATAREEKMSSPELLSLSLGQSLSLRRNSAALLAREGQKQSSPRKASWNFGSKPPSTSPVSLSIPQRPSGP
jgi:hypothetical protein